MVNCLIENNMNANKSEAAFASLLELLWWNLKSMQISLAIKMFFDEWLYVRLRHIHVWTPTSS